MNKLKLAGTYGSHSPIEPNVYIVETGGAVKVLYQSISKEDTVVEDYQSLIAMAVNAASLSVNDLENQRHNTIDDYLQTLGLSVRERETYIAYLDVFIQELIRKFHMIGLRDIGHVQFSGLDGMDIIVKVFK